MAALAACDSSLALDHPVLLDMVTRRLGSASGMRIEQRSLGRWFLDAHPERAALYAQINHFNPSTHAIASPDWNAALARLLQPEQLTPMDALRQLDCPTLLLVGSEDPIVPVSAMQDVAALVQGSEVAVVPLAGHSAYFERPDQFNRLVLDFLARRARWPHAQAAAPMAA